MTLALRVAFRVLSERSHQRFVEWWFFKKGRWRCRVRLHHDYIFTDIDGWHCSRCHVDKGNVRLFLLWGGIPLIWRVSFRLKHGRWP